MKKSNQVVVPVVIDTNVLVPSLYSYTRIAVFMTYGNILLVWNDFIYDEVLEIMERLSPIDDDPFLYAAVEGKAEYIISCDSKHMVSMGNFNNIPIGTPDEFFNWVIQEHPMRRG
ncbi:putative nucleic acid-binding protein [Heliobacterium gestii]|nr:putative nucleic acid-binding protein [Heliomicrobium gestii]